MLKVIPDLVAPVTVLFIDNAPAPVTAKPPADATLTPPTANVVDIGKSLATNAAVPVINPCALYVIPFLTDAPPVTALLIPKLPDATFNDLSILDVFNLAAVIVPSVIFVPEIPDATFASVTAELAMAAVSTELSANSTLALQL